MGENRWDLTTALPIIPEVKEGDQFMVAVVARTISAQTDDGKGLIYARMQSSTPPYEGFGDKVFKIGDRWQMVNLPFTATRGFGAGMRRSRSILRALRNRSRSGRSMSSRPTDPAR